MARASTGPLLVLNNRSSPIPISLSFVILLIYGYTKGHLVFVWYFLQYQGLRCSCNHQISIYINLKLWDKLSKIEHLVCCQKISRFKYLHLLVVASILVVLCLLWVGIEDVGFHSKGTTLNLATLPVAVGLYGYCYFGHAVFPNIYTSMTNPNQFPWNPLSMVNWKRTAVLGYTMFGEAILSQFTLNMPKELVATKIVVWTTVVNPFTKYPLYIRACMSLYIPWKMSFNIRNDFVSILHL
uniref:Amino acid transporter transmembrane domain-containing protein n=2 Tax=Glycine subgen. Soja TaxID=1462606 RepID=A0A0R0I8I3_SOYBN